ncbi:MAG TPA: sugar transferase [Roseiflexaceae bacterium]|nr:sugar transferase [Roseiflexaceae bacterium]
MSRIAALKYVIRPLTVPLRLRPEISERRLLLRTGDLSLVAASIAGALLLWSLLAGRRIDWPLLRDQAPWMLLLLGGWFLWLILNDMYNLRLVAQPGRSARRILLGGLAVGVGYLLLFFVTSRAPAGGALPGALGEAGPLLRIAPAGAIAGSTALLLTWRAFYIRVLAGPHTRRRLIILGAGAAGRAMSHIIRKSHNTYYHIVGFIDDDPQKLRQPVAGLPVLGPHERLLATALAEQVDEIVIAVSAEVRGSMFQAIMDCHEAGIAITPMPLLYERLTGRVAVEHIGSQWYVALPLQTPESRTAHSILKRLIDLVVGLALGLAFVLLLPLIALAIRLDSPGPIFYRQERVGRHGRRFFVYKLRSMRADAERDGEAQWASRDDPRITRVGRWLRRARLDELPQVLNVIRGEMSLVGPRPERPQFIAQLQREIPFYRTRLAARPGLTGWAQINYGYGNTVEDALVKLQYDLFYLKHQSPWFDLIILLRTIVVVLRLRGQ